MKKRVISLLLALLMLSVFTLTGCGGSSDEKPAETPKEEEEVAEEEESVEEPEESPAEESGLKVYRFADGYDVTSLNPHNQEDSLVADISIFSDSMLYRRVPNPDGSGDMIIGEIADGDPYLVDDEGYVWHIDLNEDAVWHNGEPINADTFIYSFKMLLDPNLVNALASMLYDYYISIENAQEYFMQNTEGAEEVAWEDVGIKKVDDYTLEIRTNQRYTAELVKLHFMLRSNYPVYEELYEAGMNDSRTSTTYGTTLDRYMGSGPYYIEEWNQDANRTYVKNEDHWMADYFNFDRVEVRVVPDANARVQLFENGEIDTMSLSGALLEKYMDDPRTREYLGLTPTHIDINSLNTVKPILGTLNFRRAMYYALNREEACDLIGYLPSSYYINHQAGGIPGILYRDTPEAKELELDNYGYDPDLAREYFDAALEEVGETSVSIELMTSETSDNNKAVAEYLQEELPKIFGEDRFELTIRFVPSASYTAIKDWKSDPNSFEMAFGGWGATLSRIYPYSAFQYFRSEYTSRPNSYITERFDEFYNELTAEEIRIDPELMVKMTAELEKVYIEDVINVPLGQQYNYTIFADRIELPVDEYLPGLGFGTIYGDVVE